MATYEIHELTDVYRPMPGLFGGLRHLVAVVVQRFRRRATVLRLARLDAVQLADIGIEADDLADALNGCSTELWAKLARRG